MRISYTGKPQKLTLPQQKKLDAKFAKLSKLIDSRKGEKEAHVILTSERHLSRAEITVQCFDHSLIGVGADAGEFQAMAEALENIEKQLLKLRAKRRDTHRGSKAERAVESAAPAEEPEAEDAGAEVPASRVFRVGSHRARKPMTLDEAVLEMEKSRDYVVYRDAESDRLSVLVRRRDGNFDLVQS
ncbi:MAG: HPF/RaiA family ribosome-associated protein [Acidobacteria bacterium]|nr:HPF/RaiA family ribosome-associated protein [Acidobacteriota bacterium]